MCCLVIATRSQAEVPKNRQYPQFHIGPTGIVATIEPGFHVTVVDTQIDTPAAGKFQEGDVITKANGRILKDSTDPRVPLGRAITEAEGNDGRLTLTIDRDGKTRQVVLTVPAIGAYSNTWPLHCKKSEHIIRTVSDLLIASQNQKGWYEFDGRETRTSLTGCLATLFLLSTGSDASMPNVKRYVHALAAEAEKNPTTSSWHLGYQLILMGEYYLKTGDRTVLPAMTKLCAKTPEGQIAGSWGHYMDDKAVGYVQSGQMNSAGVTVFLGLALARECGITAAEDTFMKALVFFYRMPGHGSICYGDHRAEIYADTNGRNAAIACAMTLFAGDVYQMSAQHLAMLIADSYYAHEFGHTGGGFNVIWRGIATMLLPEDQRHRYRRHMAELSWYYDLCRLHDGSFRILPSPETRYSGKDWGFAMGLTYTAPLRNLRITGAPKTRFSAEPAPLPALPWGTARDNVFLQSDYCKGYGQEIDPPHVIFEKVNGKEKLSAAYAAKQMRHFNPMIRTWAAYKLAELNTGESYAAFAGALKHPDPRVRRAACDGISHYTNWGRTHRETIPRAVVSEKFVPHIEAMLKDSKAAWWEIDGALWALGYAEAADIRRNMDVIKRYAAHPEWYLRESAYWSLVGLGNKITGAEFLFLGDMYTRSRHVFERSSYDAGINYLVRSAKIDLNDSTIADYVRKIGKSTHSALLAGGYDPMAARHEATHRIMMTLDRFKNPPYRLIIPDFIEYLKRWTPEYQHSYWLITGNKWQPGLCKIALDLGKSGRPLIEALRKCSEKIPPAKNRENGQLTETRKALAEALAEYDKKYGE